MIIYKIVEWRIIIIMKCKTNYSPYYYLQSNDIIYVEPNDRRKKDAYRNKDFNRYSGMFKKIYRLFRRLDTRFEIVD